MSGVFAVTAAYVAALAVPPGRVAGIVGTGEGEAASPCCCEENGKGSRSTRAGRAALLGQLCCYCCSLRQGM